MIDTVVPCDTCQARSYVFVDMSGDLELAYCGHHFQKYESNLRKVAARVVDLRHTISA